MKKLILIIPITFFACSNNPVETNESFIDSTVSLDTANVIEKAEVALQHTEGLEHKIKKTYITKEALLKENQILKQEIKIVKDSLVRVVNKIPKKKNLIQKVFNITPDSVEVITIDTIK